jgi:cation:H+ antiporter
MNAMTDWFVLILGLAILSAGAEFLVRGSAALALRLGLSPLVVGLTVVGFGTSSPEMVVSVKAALLGQGDIAVGNIVGSNIFNMGVILGLTVLICPIAIQMQLIRLDTPVMIAVTVVFLGLMHDSTISRPEGIFLFLLLVGYLIFTIRASRKESKEVESEFQEEMPKLDKPVWLEIVMVLGGLTLLVVGGRLFVEGSVNVARALGISEAIIGLTIVAAGTSMPELATSLVAAWRRAPDIAVGNVIGSNIFNILCIAGVSGIIAPFTAPGISWIDLGVMLGLSLLLLPLMRSGLKLHRWEGALLWVLYAGYLGFIWP